MTGDGSVEGKVPNWMTGPVRAGMSQTDRGCDVTYSGLPWVFIEGLTRSWRSSGSRQSLKEDVEVENLRPKTG